MTAKHIVVDARIRRASTGKPVERLLEYLQELDKTNRYTIILEANDPWQPAAANFTARPVPFRQFSFNPFSLVSYSWLLYRLKPDLVHFTMTHQSPLLYFGRQITMTHDLTMLRFVRAGRLPEWLHQIRMIGYRLLFWSGNRQARRIIVPTQFVADDLAQHYPFAKSKSRVIYEASEPPLQAKAEPLHSVAKPFILHVGSPFPHKNIERLVQAFEIMLAEVPDLQLVLPGKKEFYFAKLQRQIDASPAKDRILVPGFVSDSELKWLYENAEAYVLPALSEGFGLPGLEAMVHGCPVVSSKATCLPEVYGQAAHYFDPENVDDIVRKTLEILRDKNLRAKLIEKGYEQVKKYSWQKMSQETIAIYKETLGQS